VRRPAARGQCAGDQQEPTIAAPAVPLLMMPPGPGFLRASAARPLAAARGAGASTSKGVKAAACAAEGRGVVAREIRQSDASERWPSVCAARRRLSLRVGA
jgi:hypothetical protein